MRQSLALSASFLSLLLMSCAAVRAEPKSGWVDPPAKSDQAKSDAKQEPAKAADPDKPQTAASEESEPARRPRRMAEHPHRHTSRHEGRRRTADSSEIDTSSSDPRLAGWAGQAQRLTNDYLDSVSAPNGTMLGAAPRFYGDRVRFHGRTMGIAALMAEKKRFVRRWPERRYEAQDGTMRTACSAAGTACVVRTVMGFRAENPARNARSQGVSELTLTVSFAGAHPVIVSESSRVLRRGSAALGASEHGQNGGA